MITKNEVAGTLRAIGKICRHHCPDKCSVCPIFDLCKFLTDESLASIPETLITESAEIIENWSAVHIKTYCQDFLEKFPKTKLNLYGSPAFCRASVYGTPIDCDGLGCRECWEQEMEEDTEEESCSS